LRLVVLGIALSVPIVVWGSGLLARLMGRFTWIVWVGGGILGYVAGEMFFADSAVDRWIDGAPTLAHTVSSVLGLVIAAVGWWGDRKRRTEVRQRPRDATGSAAPSTADPAGWRTRGGRSR